MARITIVTDAWHNQVNGVVTTLQKVCDGLANRGHDVNVIEPNLFKTLPCPTYPEIPLSIDIWRVPKLIKESSPDHIHIATEGPIGWAARIYCALSGLNFSTSYHTKFPEYISSRFPVPLSWSYSVMRFFHNKARHTLVTTNSMKAELEGRGFTDLVVWTRGVDVDLFNPQKRTDLNLPTPIFLYVGRISVEKNLEDFLKADLPGTKVLVGDGPERKKLEKKYPQAVFAGVKKGEELAAYYASSDVFVFPSKTDTFGVVLLEALASGIPVAAYPVTGPKDIIINGVTGILSDDLEAAAKQALTLNKQNCREFGLKNSWKQCIDVFEDHLVQLNK